jgi:hypothetical protein
MKKDAWVWAVAGGLALGLLAAAGLNLYTRPRPAPPVPAEPGDVAPRAAASRPDAPPATRAADAPSAAPRKPRPLPFGPGETLVYDVAWMSVSAGTITMALAEERDEQGARAWRLRAEGRIASALASLYPLHYEIESSVDPDTLLPRRAVVQQQEGERRRTRVTLFDHAARRAHYEQVGGRRADVDTPAEVWDGLSALYALRAAPGPAAGSRSSWAVCDGGRVYTVEVSAGESASVDTPAGLFGADRLTPVVRDAEGRPATGAVALWLSSDARRLPLRIELELKVGRFTVTLRDVRSR